ncbi:vWA domain-containing protein [Pseudomonas sp. X10]
MRGRPLTELNAGLQQLKDELAAESLVMQRLEVPEKVEMPLTIVDGFYPPKLVEQGDTSVGQAITIGLDMLESRKAQIRVAGVRAANASHPNKQWVD